MTLEQLKNDIAAQFPEVEFGPDEDATVIEEDGEVVSITLPHSLGVTTWSSPRPERAPEPVGNV